MSTVAVTLRSSPSAGSGDSRRQVRGLSRLAHGEDIDLVRSLASRDRSVREAAFDSLFERHRDRVFNIARRVLGDPALAADVTQ